MIWLPATLFDIHALARDLRASDKHELAFSAAATGRDGPGWSILGDLLHGFGAFPHWALVDGPENDLVALAGVASLPQNPAIGGIWLLGTDLADERWFGMTRATRRWVAMNAPDWFAMGNVVPRHMKKRIDWLRHLGFDISDAEAQGEFIGHVAFWSHRQDGPDDPQAAP